MFDMFYLMISTQTINEKRFPVGWKTTFGQTARRLILIHCRIMGDVWTWRLRSLGVWTLVFVMAFHFEDIQKCWNTWIFWDLQLWKKQVLKPTIFWEKLRFWWLRKVEHHAKSQVRQQQPNRESLWGLSRNSVPGLKIDFPDSLTYGPEKTTPGGLLQTPPGAKELETPLRRTRLDFFPFFHAPNHLETWCCHE